MPAQGTGKRSTLRQQGKRRTIEVSDVTWLIISEYKKQLEDWITPDARGKKRRVSMDEALKSLLSHRQPGGFERLVSNARSQRSKRVAEQMTQRAEYPISTARAEELKSGS